MRFSRRPVENTELLRMTEWVDEIATSLRSSQSDCVTIIL
jgi:hypothetical protein